jgi:hypothetical protein
MSYEAKMKANFNLSWNSDIKNAKSFFGFERWIDSDGCGEGLRVENSKKP